MKRLVSISIMVLIWAWPAFIGQTAIPPFGDGIVTLYNIHSKEIRTIKYKDGNGYLQKGVAELNRILRDRMTGEETEMSLKLIELVNDIQNHFAAREIEVISGYRSQALNSMLRSTGHRVASRSLHMAGLAMDIRIKGVPLQEIRDYTRSLKLGGVGYYPGQFVHIDVGPVRYW